MKPPLPVVSARVRRTAPALIDLVGRACAERRASGGRLFPLAQAVPDFPPPPHVCEALQASLADEATHRYTVDPGLPELRQAIARVLGGRRGVEWDAAEQVLVTAGANLAFAEVLPAIVDAGDVVVNPSNPIGSVIGRADMERLLAFAAAHRLWVVSDETYEDFVLDAPPDGWASAASVPGHEERVVVLGSFTKSAGLSGWRVGWIAGPAALLNELMKAHDTMIICAPVAGQQGAPVVRRREHRRAGRSAARAGVRVRALTARSARKAGNPLALSPDLEKIPLEV